VERINYYCSEAGKIEHQNVLFTDESSFNLMRNTIKIFKFRGQPKPQQEKLPSNVSQMIWAAISRRGKSSIYFVDGWIDQNKYTQLLRKARKEIHLMFAGEKFHFVQDNASSHNAPKSLKYISKYITPNIKSHPPQSPDLNPIELVWAILKSKVEVRRPTTLIQLQIAILESWNEITIDTIRKCIDTLPRKLEKAFDEAVLKVGENFEN
jgi:DDE superfamily endonuclease